MSKSVIDYNHCFCINFVPAELIMKIKRTMTCVQSIIIMHWQGFSKLYLIIVLTKYLCTTISQRRNLKFSIMGIKMIILTSQLFPKDLFCLTSLFLPDSMRWLPGNDNPDFTRHFHDRRDINVRSGFNFQGNDIGFFLEKGITLRASNCFELTS